MIKSLIFKVAHEVARNTVRQVGDYQVALKLALKLVYSSLVNNIRPMQYPELVTTSIRKGLKDFGITNRKVAVNIHSKGRTYAYIYINRFDESISLSLLELVKLLADGKRSDRLNAERWYDLRTTSGLYSLNVSVCDYANDDFKKRYRQFTR